jgi:hypothetical protein
MYGCHLMFSGMAGITGYDDVSSGWFPINVYQEPAMLSMDG